MELEPELRLPEDLRRAACRSGNEWGWSPEHIPHVIVEAEKLGLLNIGGQLQFLLPDGICECYWVDVEALLHEPPSLNWKDRVIFAASTAMREFERISAKFDFIAEGRKAFREPFENFEASGGNLTQAMCFIWYLEGEEGGAN